MITPRPNQARPPEDGLAVPFRVNLFGPMQVLLNGQPMPHVRSRKALWLLALLAMRRDRAVEREWLASTLWPDVPMTQSYDSLRPRLAELRRALGDHSAAIKPIGRRAVRLDTALCSVDLYEFDAAVESDDTTAWERAAALYRGPLLEGCVEEWVFQERNVREQNCLRTLVRLGAAALESGSHAKAADHYRRAVLLDPLQDTAVRGLMEALSGGGDTNAALHAFREFDHALRSHRAAPDPETSALYMRLRGSAQSSFSHPAWLSQRAAPAPISGNLPPMFTSLVGRDDERVEIAERLRRERLVTLTGTGGIGKTRLGQAAALDATRQFPDGVWMIALETVSDARLVASHIASALKLPEQTALTPLQQVAEHLEGKQALLVLDSCEHLLEECARVADVLIAACSGLRLLATSREALRIVGECVHPVPPLTTPAPDGLPNDPAELTGALLGCESVELFVQRAQAARADFALTAANGRVVAEVCTQMEGIPLAIELAAARVRVMTVEQIAERLHDRLGLLTGGPRNAPSRQKTMRATLDWSYALLTPEEQLLLNRMSVFVGGCSIEAIERVCTGDGVDETLVVDLLSGLADKSLVKVAEQTVTARYYLLEIVRQYAAERFGLPGASEAVRGRHLDWCLTLADEARPHLGGSDSASWLSRIDLERENMRAALDRAAGGPPQTLLRLTWAFWAYLSVRGYYREAHGYIQRALLGGGEEATSETYAQLLCAAAAVATRFGDFQAARDAHERCLRLTRAQGYPAITAQALNGLGWIALRQARLPEARASFLRCLELYHELGDQAGVDRTLYSVAALAHRRADFAESDRYGEEALRSYRASGNASWLTNTLTMLGLNAYYQDNFERAGTYQREAARIQREQGNRGEKLAYAILLQGLISVAQANAAGAAESFTEALAVFRDAGVPEGAADALSGMGAAAQAAGDLAAAAAHYREGLAIRLRLELKDGVVGGLVEAAGLLAESRPRDTVLLWAAADALQREQAVLLCSWQRKDVAGEIAQTRSTLGPEVFDAAWREGAALDWRGGTRLALQALAAHTPPLPPA